jgi:hypothetical protein
MAALRHTGTPLGRALVDRVPTRNPTIGALSGGPSVTSEEACIGAVMGGVWMAVPVSVGVPNLHLLLRSLPSPCAHTKSGYR